MFTDDHRQQFEMDGYVVINVLDAYEVANFKTKFSRWANTVRPEIPSHGVMNRYEVAHQPFMWEIRVNEKVQNPFKNLYNTNDLVVSFDGLGYMPPELNRKDTDWFHFDQAPNSPKFEIAQGLVSYTPNFERMFRCVPGSQRYFGQYFEKAPVDKKEESKAFQKVPLAKFNSVLSLNLKPKDIPIKPGQMIIWDSRLLHQNVYGAIGEERLVQYVSYRPKHGRSVAMKAKRELYFNEKRATTHWAYPVKVVGTQPQVYGDTSKLIDYSTLPPITYNSSLLKRINKLI